MIDIGSALVPAALLSGIGADGADVVLRPLEIRGSAAVRRSESALGVCRVIEEMLEPFSETGSEKPDNRFVSDREFSLRDIGLEIPGFPASHRALRTLFPLVSQILFFPWRSYEIFLL